MPDSAFTSGIRSGGLTDATQIRVLICYLIQNYGPIGMEDLQGALWDSQLVNYFELVSAVNDLCRLNNLSEQKDGYHITAAGATAAGDLITTVPLSVRERAMDALLKLRAYSLQAAQSRTEIRMYGDEFLLHCHIDDMGRMLMECSLAFPDLEIAEYAKRRFIENSASIYQLLIAGLTNDQSLAADFFEGSPKPKTTPKTGDL